MRLTFRLRVLPVVAILLLATSGCQAVRNALGETTPRTPASSGPAASATPQPQFLITPNPNQPSATIQKTTPPMVVLTQPTPTEIIPQVTLTAGISKPSLLQIEAPGPDSKIRDFVWVRANVYPGDGGNFTILLTGEDGRTIAQRDVTQPNWTTGWLSIAEQIQFTPSAASETALLSIFTRDGFGRIITLTSERILMLQVGPEEIELPGFHGDPFVMTQPMPSGVSQKGILHFEGFAHVTETTPVSVELIQMDGSILASGEIKVAPVNSSEGYVPFSGELTYQVNQRTPVRFTVRQESPDFGSMTTALSSYIIYLDP